MTLGALRDPAVDVVAEGTVKGGVLACVLPELIDLLRVTGDAGLRDIPVIGDLHRPVRIFVTGKAALELVVRLSAVAVAALRNGFLYLGRMTGMTAFASHVLVLPSRGCQVRRRGRMALRAEIACLSGLGLRGRGAFLKCKRRDPHEQE